jgi:uncharacterized repeat protein (TIGR02543 family)
MSDIWIKTSSTATTKWRKAINIHIKRFATGTTKWYAAKVIWIKNTSTSWLRVWPTSGVFALTDPYITTTSSGSTPLYAVDNTPIRIGTTYYGRNGTWDPNGFSISSYTYTWQYFSDAANQLGDYDLLGNIGTGTYTSPSNALTISSSATASLVDGKYISFKIRANASNDLYSSSADSKDSYGKIKVVRRTPQNLSYNISGEAAVGSTLSFSSSWNITEAYKPDAARTTMKWYYVNDLTDFYSTGSRVEITRASGSYSFTIQTSDNLLGKYIVAEETVFNTGSDFDLGENVIVNGQNQVTAVTSAVGVTLALSNGRVHDTNDNRGLDNRGDLPVGSYAKFKATATGVDANTTYRIRYRVYNWQNSTYYNVSTGATGTATSSWTTYSADGTGSGNISSVIISGSTAEISDSLYINETYFGTTTYSGGIKRWQLEVEISVIKTGGTRVFLTNPYDPYYLSQGSNSTISASPSTVGVNSSTTISGAFSGYPSGAAFPYQYKVDYGDGTDSGWLPTLGYTSGTSNPTYSLTKSYSSTGSKTVYITTIPYYTSNSVTVTVANLYTITFDSKGGSAVSALTQTSSGGSIAKPTDPTRSNYSFGGWSTTDGGTTAVTWPRTPASNETLYAIWTALPVAPTSLTATKNNNTKITLTWSGGSGTSYEFYWTTSSGTLPSALSTADFSTTELSTYDWDGGTRGTLYYLFIRAVSGTAKSGWYPSAAPGIEGKEPLYAPPTPVITNSAQTTTSLSWHWTAPTPSTTQDSPTSWDYKITSDTTAPTSGLTNITTRPLAATPLVTTGLTANTTYYLHVRAKNGDADGTWTYQSGTTSAVTFNPVVWGTMANPAFDRLNSSSRLRWGWNNQLPTSGDYTASNITWEWQYSSSNSTTTQSASPVGLISSGTRPNRSTGGLTVGASAYNNRVSSISADYTTGNPAGTNEPVTFSTASRFLRYRAVVVGSNGTTYRSNYSQWV